MSYQDFEQLVAKADIECLSKCILEANKRITSCISETNQRINQLAAHTAEALSKISQGREDGNSNKSKLIEIQSICNSVLTSRGFLAFSKHELMALILEKVGNIQN